MSLNERIKKLRKSLDLTQAEFGRRIGMKQNTIALIEGGRNTSDQTVFAICREFHVNEDWLRTGNGGDDAMFVSTPQSKLDALAETHGLTDEQYTLLRKFIVLEPEIRQGILDYIRDVAAAISRADASDPLKMSDEELHAELDRQLEIEKGTTAKSEAS